MSSRQCVRSAARLKVLVGLWCHRAAARRFARLFDTNQDGVIQREEFCDFVKFLWTSSFLAQDTPEAGLGGVDVRALLAFLSVGSLLPSLLP